MTVTNPCAYDDGAGLGIVVVAPARLHMGFLDLGGSLGRKFGSLGIGLDEIVTRIRMTPADAVRVEGPGAERAAAAAERMAQALERPLPADIRIETAIPAHAGLGSGTQLALAIGAGLARLHGLDLGPRDLAPLLGRGARSGIGIAVFEAGGLILDGGHGPHTLVPPVLSRLELPPAWRFLLVLDHTDRGLHGPQEIAAFRKLPEFPAEAAARLCHQVLMRGLPAAAEGDLAAFGAVVTELQTAVGSHFASFQGGSFASPDVAAAIQWLGGAGAVGLGQSSWGPTGFCLVDGAERAEALLDRARASFGDRPGLEFRIGTTRRRGADIVPVRLAAY